ncbi:MAG: hypothetical protein ACR2H3_10680 [Acidimicrobiales bacterium]
MANHTNRDLDIASNIEDPFLRRSVKTALHMRRYAPFYIFTLIWIVALATLPSIANRGNDNNVASGGNDFSASTNSGLDVGDGTTDGSTDVATGAGSTSGGSATNTGRTAAGTASRPPGGGGATPISANQAKEAIQRNTGKTRLGIDCTPGVKQVPASRYATPCQNVYNGPNGGVTSRGVTADKIKIIQRKFPDSANSRAVDEVNSAAGFASADVVEEVRKEFIKFFNKSYELYGRQVDYSVYTSENGDSTNEAQSKGKEGACQDAEKIAKEMKVFGVLGGSTVFGECAAERQTMVFTAGAYYPENWYRKYHPYLWHTIMECERISYQVAEYIGKRLHGKNAKWAGDAVLRNSKRHYGTYVPDNDGYQSCVEITKREMRNKYGVTDTGEQFNYTLDISRFPDQAANAAVQFSSRGVTTVILACDYISTTVLTAAAERQQWRPEWLQIGTALNDTDNAARLFEQKQVNGHLFGPSQLGATNKLIGPNSEPGQVYKIATGKTIPEGTSGDYYTLSLMFNLLQAAGPVLTPDNAGRGAMTIPAGGAPDFPLGYWSLQDGSDGTPGAGDHTVVDDSREVYWVCQATEGQPTCSGKASDPYFNGPDGNNGTFKETYGGKRFRNNEWPREDPPIYPAR